MVNLVIEPPKVDTSKSKGGTELMVKRITDNIDPKILENFTIIPSRFRESDLEEGKKPILWLHDLPNDPESQHLKEEGWKKFSSLVFVSHWQKQQYQNFLGVPPSAGVVLQNCIDPIPEHTKPKLGKKKKKVNLIYHTTPHRGLGILVPVFAQLIPEFEKEGYDVHLDVYSSFKIYGWDERDKEFEDLYKQIEEHPNMTYHGFQPQSKVRKALQKAHIFAYPSIWQETSCLALIEAMSAGCLCVHSSLAALPETSCNWNMMYEFTEDINIHANRFAQTLFDSVRMIEDDSVVARLNMQKQYVNGFYNTQVRTAQWSAYLQSLLA